MTKNIKYHPRIIDDIIRQKLKSVGAILIEGPKWCGKTTTAEQATKSKLGLECDAVLRAYGGAYGFVQIKLGGSQTEIEQAAHKMQELEAKLAEGQPRPVFHMVLTGANNVAYRRKDGLYVVPI